MKAVPKTRLYTAAVAEPVLSTDSSSYSGNMPRRYVEQLPPNRQINHLFRVLVPFFQVLRLNERNIHGEACPTVLHSKGQHHDISKRNDC
jgi:hypothetical protein